MALFCIGVPRASGENSTFYWHETINPSRTPTWSRTLSAKARTCPPLSLRVALHILNRQKNTVTNRGTRSKSPNYTNSFRNALRVRPIAIHSFIQRYPAFCRSDVLHALFSCAQIEELSLWRESARQQHQQGTRQPAFISRATKHADETRRS